ncbi:MAG: dihydroorotate dehydrogenase [Myxococcota bacterium]
MTVDLTAFALGRAWKTPVLAASGTFGYGQEYEGLTDLSALGGIVTKGLSPRPRAGNPLARICETPSGMLNSIGLENVGVEGFLRGKLPFLRALGTRVVVNFFGERFEEYAECAALLDGHEGIDALEMNVSCPNIKAGGMEYGTDPETLRRLVASCRRATRLPLIVKLTPNVTDIVAIARAAVDGGADGLAVINTVSGMAIDARARRPKLATIFGGLSGPAVKPIAQRMVYQVARARLGVPIFGMGGIRTGEDAAEFLLAGATLVQVGTWNFVDPDATARVARELAAFLAEVGCARPADLVGKLELDESLLPHTPGGP